MATGLESKNLLKMSEPLIEFTTHLEGLFPSMEWDLKRSGYTITTPQYLAVSFYLSIVIGITGFVAFVLPVMVNPEIGGVYISVGLMVVFTIAALVVLLIQPKMKINRRERMIDKDLEYVLKDIQIQLSAGVPLFDTLVNIARGEYGECSDISQGIIREVQSGKSMTEVLDDVGMWSPSEHLRQSLWQIVNALRSGSDVTNALEAISKTIRIEKQNKIRAYSKELNLWGLVYMMGAVVIPSMGVTLLVILSSFMGSGIINETLFWMILTGITIFQAIFLTFIRDKRPII